MHVYSVTKGGAERNVQVYNAWSYFAETDEKLRYLLLLGTGSSKHNVLSTGDLIQKLHQHREQGITEMPRIVITRDPANNFLAQPPSVYVTELKRLSDLLSTPKYFDSASISEEELLNRISSSETMLEYQLQGQGEEQ